MTDADRELVELAAKAYGLQVKGWLGDKLRYFDPVTGFGDWDQKWNPLENDGDSLRLVSKLKLCICFYCDHGLNLDLSCVSVTDSNDEIFSEEKFKYYEPDRTKALRRAITRAAAEIGRGLG